MPPPSDAPTIIDVNAGNVEEHGFFCLMSRRKSTGYQRKLAWTRLRFQEGMRIKLLELPERGFIEYMPGEACWRPIWADGYFVVHCLWVVGRSKGKGQGRALLQACIDDARKSGAKGVAMVTSQGNWLAGRKLLKQMGFHEVDAAPPSFSLMCLPFGKHPAPRFIPRPDLSHDCSRCSAVCALRTSYPPDSPEELLAPPTEAAILPIPEECEAPAFPAGSGRTMTIYRTDQCPYLDDAVTAAAAAAHEVGIETHIIDITSRRELLSQAPSPYGVFGVTINDQLIAHHYLLEKEWKGRVV